LEVSDNTIEYIGGRNSSVGIHLGGSEFVNITSNHIGLALEETSWEGSGIFINRDSNHVVIENNDLSGCGCLIKILSSKPDIQVSVLEQTTIVQQSGRQSGRLPFSFTYQVPAQSSGPDSSGDIIHYINYNVSGESAIKIGSIQAIPSKYLLIIKLDRNDTIADKAGSADIEIPKQLMNKVSRATAYSTEYNDNNNTATAVSRGTVSDNDEPKVLAIEGSDEPVLFAEHQSKQSVPFQRLASGPNSNIIRLIIPETAQVLEIQGIGGWMELSSSFNRDGSLSSLSSSKIGIVAAILSVIGALGGTILILGRRDDRRMKKIISYERDYPSSRTEGNKTSNYFDSSGAVRSGLDNSLDNTKSHDVSSSRSFEE
jgi:hypothetical protein